jgi:hypothetical protein
MERNSSTFSMHLKYYLTEFQENKINKIKYFSIKDYVFLLISCTIIIVSPFVLFGEFLVRDITRPPGSRCGCDHTFI